MRAPRRMIEPIGDMIADHEASAFNVLRPRDVGRSLDQAARRSSETAGTANVSLAWYRANIGASGDAAYLMRVAAPSSDAAWAMLNLALPMPAAGYLVAGWLWSSEARSGGTATLRARIIDTAGTNDYDLADCVLDGTNTQAMSAALVNSSIRFAKGATIEGRVVTAGTWAPTTADVGAVITVSLDL